MWYQRLANLNGASVASLRPTPLRYLDLLGLLSSRSHNAGDLLQHPPKRNPVYIQMRSQCSKSRHRAAWLWLRQHCYLPDPKVLGCSMMLSSRCWTFLGLRFPLWWMQLKLLWLKLLGLFWLHLGSRVSLLECRVCLFSPVICLSSPCKFPAIAGRLGSGCPLW